MPTPPAAACTSTVSPGLHAGQVDAARSEAVRNAIGTDAAWAYDQPGGIGTTAAVGSVTAVEADRPVDQAEHAVAGRHVR